MCIGVACYQMLNSFGWEGEQWCVFMTKCIQYCRNCRCMELFKWVEFDWNGFRRLESFGCRMVAVQLALRCAFTAENVTKGPRVLTQRRCSSKGSSVDSARGVGGFPVVNKVGSKVWVAPRGSCVRLTSCRSAGGVGCNNKMEHV